MRDATYTDPRFRYRAKKKSISYPARFRQTSFVFYALMHSFKPLCGQIMHYFNSRRRRFAASTSVALIFLTTIALFYNVVVDHLRDALHDGPDNSGPDNSEAVPETEVRPEGRNLIPPKIWQILLPKKGNTDPVSPKQLQDTASWLALNTDYS